MSHVAARNKKMQEHLSPVEFKLYQELSGAERSSVPFDSVLVPIPGHPVFCSDLPPS